MDRATFGGDLPRDPLAEGDTNLGPELGLDSLRNANPEHLGAGIDQHQAASLGAGDPHGDLEHSLEEFVCLDRQVHGFDDLVEGLEEFGLAITGGHSVAPEQTSGQRGDDLKRRSRAGGDVIRKITTRIDDRVEILLREECGGVVDEQRRDMVCERCPESACAFERVRDLGVEDARDLYIRVAR